jgi:hypothetical protein
LQESLFEINIPPTTIQVCHLKEEIKSVRVTNIVLAEQNAVQADLLVRSRPASPLCLRPSSRACSPSPCRLSRSNSNCSLRQHQPPHQLRATSPTSPTHCTQLIRQDLLLKRFDELFCRERLAAMDSLRSFSDCHENNQRILFAAVQAAFAVAKKQFGDWKVRVRSTVAITHCGPDTLEEAVQSYINRSSFSVSLCILLSRLFLFVLLATTPFLNIFLLLI